MCTHASMCVCVCVCVCKFLCLYIYMCVCECVCVCARARVRVKQGKKNGEERFLFNPVHIIQHRVQKYKFFSCHRIKSFLSFFPCLQKFVLEPCTIRYHLGPKKIEALFSLYFIEWMYCRLFHRVQKVKKYPETGHCPYIEMYPQGWRPELKTLYSTCIENTRIYLVKEFASPP